MGNIDIIKLCAIKYPLQTVQSVEPIILDLAEAGGTVRPLSDYINPANQVFLGDIDITAIPTGAGDGLVLEFLDFNIAVNNILMKSTSTPWVSVFYSLKNLWISDINYFSIVNTQFYITGKGYRITFAP